MRRLLFLLLLTPFLHAAKYETAVCAIFKNEAPFLKEWIDYHLSIGVEQFYLYNHQSGDNYQQVLAPYIRRNLVQLTDWNHEAPDLVTWNNVQCHAYNDCINRVRKKVKWLAVIDIDEFICLVKDKNLSQFLKDYRDVGGVCLHWQLFGTSYVKAIPPGKLLETLILKASADHPENAHVKTICRPSRTSHMDNPHYAHYFAPFFQVSTTRQRFAGPANPFFDINRARINHYWTRDEDTFFTYKYPKRLAWGESLESQLARLRQLNQVTDTTILRKR